MLKLINELGPEAVFDSETLRILTAAFDAAWASIEASGTPLSKADYAEPAREIIGKHIIKAATSAPRRLSVTLPSASGARRKSLFSRARPSTERKTSWQRCKQRCI